MLHTHGDFGCPGRMHLMHTGYTWKQPFNVPETLGKKKTNRFNRGNSLTGQKMHHCAHISLSVNKLPVRRSTETNGQRNWLIGKHGGLLPLMDKCSLRFHFPKHKPETLHYRWGLHGSTLEQNQWSALMHADASCSTLIPDVNSACWRWSMDVWDNGY